LELTETNKVNILPFLTFTVSGDTRAVILRMLTSFLDMSSDSAVGFTSFLDLNFRETIWSLSDISSSKIGFTITVAVEGFSMASEEFGVPKNKNTLKYRSRSFILGRLFHQKIVYSFFNINLEILAKVFNYTYYLILIPTPNSETSAYPKP